jgi:hypothetical protein
MAKPYLKIDSTECSLLELDKWVRIGWEVRADLRHGPNAAYVHGCVCSESREHQRVRMAKTAASSSHSVSYRYS